MPHFVKQPWRRWRPIERIQVSLETVFAQEVCVSRCPITVYEMCFEDFSEKLVVRDLVAPFLSPFWDSPAWRLREARSVPRLRRARCAREASFVPPTLRLSPLSALTVLFVPLEAVHFQEEFGIFALFGNKRSFRGSFLRPLDLGEGLGDP